MKLKLVLPAVLFSSGFLFAEEGMFTFNNLPVEKIEADHGFKVTKEWSEKLMRASLRLDNGGSGSFVSANGLVLTNHHVARDFVAELSKEGNDLIKKGYYAPTLSKELKVADANVDQLREIEDVTAKIKAALVGATTPEQVNVARREAKKKLIQDCEDATKLKCEINDLYQGGIYHMHKYKRYTDVRVVFVPEEAGAFFGGDTDNFEFPRYNLDMTLLRVYENGKPAATPDFYKWSAKGAQPDELLFVPGNPGSTNRQLTYADLQMYKTFRLGLRMRNLPRLLKKLNDYSKLNPENKRRAQGDIFGIENGLKVFGNQTKNMTDAVMDARKKQEEELKALAAAKPELAEKVVAWKKIEDIAQVTKKYGMIYRLIEERGGATLGLLFTYARVLVRAAAEDKKPETEKLPEFAKAGREQLKQSLFSEAPIYKDLEKIKMQDTLEMLTLELASGSRIVRKIMAGKGTDARAAELIDGTALDRPAVRKEIYEAGAAGIEKYKNDPMIQLALLIDGDARKVRKIYEEQVTTPSALAYQQIGEIRFAVFGTSVYPDATFSPRVSYGSVKGYKEDNGDDVEWATYFKDAFLREEKMKGKKDFDLPQSWHDHKEKIGEKVPFNFVSTNDITGGNSGSALVNRDLELVGLAFDGNRQSIMGAVAYDMTQNRTVSVHSAGMTEALTVVYKTENLLNELLKGAAPVEQ